MNTEQLASWMQAVEWYDNSRLETILSCLRKGYYQSVLKLAKRVGDGANFGTACHAALASYADGWGKRSEPVRRAAALSAFAEQWQDLFPQGCTCRTDLHSYDNGVDILDDYFDRTLGEDPLYKPIDPELGFIVRIAPRDGEPNFEPFYYAGRIDGVWERVGHGDIWSGEAKTTSGGAERRIKSLTFHRQPVGYVACLRELVRQGKFPGISDPARIAGSFVTVILVASQKREFDREFFPMSLERTDSWRRQTIRLVNEWRMRLDRNRLAQAGLLTGEWGDPLDVFYQNTEECTKYGLCPYWDLCNFGPSHDTLSEFERDNWNPLLPGKRPAPMSLVTSEGVISLGRM